MSEEIIGPNPCQSCGGEYGQHASDCPDGRHYALSYGQLQEIHLLCGLVYGSKMNLPTEMIRHAKGVSNLLAGLRLVEETKQWPPAGTIFHE